MSFKRQQHKVIRAQSTETEKMWIPSFICIHLVGFAVSAFLYLRVNVDVFHGFFLFKRKGRARRNHGESED